jgi:hypothetical protein
MWGLNVIYIVKITLVLVMHDSFPHVCGMIIDGMN